jgi:hypothetical protein
MTGSVEVAPASWTCARCTVIARWAGDEAHASPPAAWAEEGDDVYCLACRRERAGEAGLRAAPDGTPAEERVRLRMWALIEFEIGRDPERPNGQIARAVRSSVPAVAKARRRLDEEAQRAPVAAGPGAG